MSIMWFPAGTAAAHPMWGVRPGSAESPPQGEPGRCTTPDESAPRREGGPLPARTASANPVGGRSRRRHGRRWITPCPPPSSRPARADRISVVPRNRWSRFTTVSRRTGRRDAVVLTGSATARRTPTPPSPRSNARSTRTGTNSNRSSRSTTPTPGLAAKRQQADALAGGIAPLERLVERRDGQGQRARRPRRTRARTVSTAQRDARQPLAQRGLVGQLEMLDRFAHQPAAGGTRGARPARRARREEGAAGRDGRRADRAPRRQLAAEEEADRRRDRPAAEAAALKAPTATAAAAAAPGALPGWLPRRRRGRRRSSSPAPRSASPTSGAPAGPNSYDCSGLMLAAWAQGRGVVAAQRRQQRGSTRRQRADLRPGDLVFYYGDMHHVGDVRRRRLGGARLAGRSTGQDEAGRRRSDPQLRPPG